MKNIFKIFLLFCVSITLITCKDDLTEPGYDGDPVLHFISDAPETAKIIINTGSIDYKLAYGVTKVVSQDHTVNLIFDADNSTAVLGTDFTIESTTDVLANGTTNGDFTINITEAAATAGKVAVFKLESATLTEAEFSQELVVQFELSCPLPSNFGLTYNADVYAFNEQAPSHSVTLVPVEGTVDQFTMTSAWGPNFVAWAAGDPSYSGAYLYAGTLTINNCNQTTSFAGKDAWAVGGPGTYDPISGVITMYLEQELFTGAFTTQVILTPN